MPTFEGETLKERYQREALIDAKIDAKLAALRDFAVVVFVEGERIVLSVKAEYQGAATTKVLEMFDELPKGFTMICKEQKGEGHERNYFNSAPQAQKPELAAALG